MGLREEMSLETYLHPGQKARGAAEITSLHHQEKPDALASNRGFESIYSAFVWSHNNNKVTYFTTS
jgi:hypothetical protein